MSAEKPSKTGSEPRSLPRNKAKLSQTTGYYAAFVALGLVGASLGPTLPGLAENTQTVLSGISFLFTARGLGYLLGSFFGGRIYDRVPGHPVMAMTLVTMSSMLVLAPLMSVLWLLTGVIFVLGMGEGVLDVGGNASLVWVHREKVGPFMNALHFFFGVGAFLSPIIIAQAVLMGGDITWAYWVLALLVLPVAFVLLRLPSPAAQMDSERTQVGSDPPQTSRVNDKSLLIALIVVFFFLYVGMEIGYAGWIFTYAVKSGLADETSAAYLTSAFFGAFTLGRLAAIPIAARVRPRSMLLGDLIGGIVSVGMLLLWRSSLTATWLGTIGLGLSLASIFPTTLTFAEHRMTLTGQVTSWFFVGASAGGMFWPWLIGQLFESIGPQVVMSAVLIDLLLATGVFLALIFHSERLAGRRAEHLSGMYTE